MENVADLMASSLTPESLSAVRAVGAAAEAADVDPFLVGGSVRDLLLARADALDIDITLVGADGSTFTRIAELTGGQITRRSQFVTAKLQLDSLEIDLAMSRAEEYPTQGSLPVVRPGSLREDLSRRDFSVNAMAVSLSSETWGEVTDLHEGIADLSERRLRILHGKSFHDDPTRILRAARYSSRLALKTTPGTRTALLEAVSLMDSVSPARVRNELDRVLQERDTQGAMKYLSDWGALRAIHPSLEFLSEAWGRFSAGVEGFSDPERISLGYAILACGISDADANGLVRRLNPGAQVRRSIQEASTLGRTADTNLEDCTNSELAVILDPLSESAEIGVGLARGGELGARISRYLRCHRDLRPHLTGGDLIQMGVPRGPAVGDVLHRLRNSWLDGEVSSATEERALAKRLAGEF